MGEHTVGRIEFGPLDTRPTPVSPGAHLLPAQAHATLPLGEVTPPQLPVYVADFGGRWGLADARHILYAWASDTVGRGELERLAEAINSRDALRAERDEALRVMQERARQVGIVKAERDAAAAHEVALAEALRDLNAACHNYEDGLLTVPVYDEMRRAQRVLADPSPAARALTERVAAVEKGLRVACHTLTELGYPLPIQCSEGQRAMEARS